MTALTPELEAIKAKQKATWSAGDYGVVAKNLEASALDFLARIPIEPDEATVMILGIYEDTGGLTFSTTTPRDFFAAGQKSDSLAAAALST